MESAVVGPDLTLCLNASRFVALGVDVVVILGLRLKALRNVRQFASVFFKFECIFINVCSVKRRTSRLRILQFAVDVNRIFENTRFRFIRHIVDSERVKARRRNAYRPFDETLFACVNRNSFNAVVVLELSDGIVVEVTRRLDVRYRVGIVALFGLYRIKTVLADVVVLVVLVESEINVVESSRLKLEKLTVRPRRINGNERCFDVDLIAVLIARRTSRAELCAEQNCQQNCKDP